MQNAFEKTLRVDLRPSPLARSGLMLLYASAFAVIWPLQIALASKLALAFAVVAHLGLCLRHARRLPSIGSIAVGPRDDFSFCDRAARPHPVAAFRVERIFCYYLQMGIRFTDGRRVAACIPGDATAPLEFRRLRLHAARCRGRGWIACPETDAVK